MAQCYFYDPKNVTKRTPFSEHNFNAAQDCAIIGPDADFTIGEPLARWKAAKNLRRVAIRLSFET